MASLIGYPEIGMPYPVSGTAPTFSTFNIDGGTDQIEWLFGVPSGWGGGAITRLGLRQSSITGTPGVARLSLQGVTSGGRADGTIKASGNAYADWTPGSGDNNTFLWKTLGASYTPSAGEVLAVVLKVQSGTWDGSNFLTANTSLGQVRTASGSRTHWTVNAGSATRGSAYPLVAWGTASLAFGNPTQAITSTAYTTTSTPDEYALKFRWPSGAGSSLAVAGATILHQTPSSGGTWEVVLYDGTTAVQSVTAPGEVATNAVRAAEYLFDESSLVALTPGSDYRVALKPTGGTANFQLPYLSVGTAADLHAFPGGEDWCLSTRADAGAWADDTASRPFVALLLADLTGGAGGSSGGYVIGG